MKNNRVEDNFTAQGLDKVRKVLNYNKLSPAKQRSYDKTIDRKLGWDSAIKTAKIEGRSEGEAKGEAERKQLQQALAAEKEKAAAKDAALAAEKEKAAAALAEIAQLKQLSNKKPIIHK
ncbi:hypothetical protein FACS189467_6300 [Bacteroidia bacterium]|nr:hypothetical protein FACS189467_6300 [Bacteroidia bacterium]